MTNETLQAIQLTVHKCITVKKADFKTIDLKPGNYELFESENLIKKNGTNWYALNVNGQICGESIFTWQDWQRLSFVTIFTNETDEF